jgi:hypothetical protein
MALGNLIYSAGLMVSIFIRQAFILEKMNIANTCNEPGACFQNCFRFQRTHA